MASDNETVAAVVAEMRGETYPVSQAPNIRMRELADRIEAAHRREVAELRGERSGILKANASLAADNDRLRREVAELKSAIEKALKDAETYRDERDGAMRHLRETNAKVSKLRDIIDSLTGLAEFAISSWCDHCSCRGCPGKENCSETKDDVETLQRARKALEATKGAEDEGK